MNPNLLRVTQRIVERSRDTRSAYLARIEQAKSTTVHRSQLACGNLAHGFAACQPDDKASLKSMLRNNIAIITSYNDMLSAHQPYEHYPDIIRKALHEANAVGGRWRCSCDVRRCDPGTGWDGAFAVESRSDCYVGCCGTLTQYVRRRVIPWRVRQNCPRSGDGGTVIWSSAFDLYSLRPDG